MDNREIVKRIRELSKKRNAVLLAHNYQRPEIQDLADHTGDSLGLSIIASETDADVIVFCGVHFMAESAAILSPDKRVLLPRTEAGCPMADTITADQLKDFKADHPGSKVVTYVNSTAETKALSDICCTSANAVKVVNSVDSLRILFTPDRNRAIGLPGIPTSASSPGAASAPLTRSSPPMRSWPPRSSIPMPSSWPIPSAARRCSIWPTPC